MIQILRVPAGVVAAPLMSNAVLRFRSGTSYFSQEYFLLVV